MLFRLNFKVRFLIEDREITPKPNFKFSLKGFHKISDYDVAIKDKEI